MCIRGLEGADHMTKRLGELTCWAGKLHTLSCSLEKDRYIPVFKGMLHNSARKYQSDTFLFPVFLRPLFPQAWAHYASDQKWKKKRKRCHLKVCRRFRKSKHALGAVQKGRRLLGWAHSRINNHRIETSSRVAVGYLSTTQNRINTTAAARILSGSEMIAF